MCNAHNHPPDCTCGWGGEGHIGRTDSHDSFVKFPRSSIRGVRVWREVEFTRPTNCPECGQKCYFVRHNGGSVWLDELGWPWPKHGCFDKPEEATRTFSTWAVKSLNLSNPQLGIVKRIRNIPKSEELLVEVKLTNYSRVSFVLRWSPQDETILGSLLIFSEADCVAFHPKYAEIPFHSFNKSGLDTRDYFTCPKCKAWVKQGTGHEEYCKNRKKSMLYVADAQPDSKQYVPVPRPEVGKKRTKPDDKLKLGPSSSNSKPAVNPLDNLFRLRQEKITKIIDSIATEAWRSVTSFDPIERLKQAKHEALRLIGLLSPSIKREVETHFTSNKWMPLIEKENRQDGADDKSQC